MSAKAQDLSAVPEIVDGPMDAAALRKLPREGLLKLLAHPSEIARANAARGLAAHGALDSNELMSLGVLARDEDSAVRAAVAAATTAAKDPTEAGGILLRLIADPSPDVRAVAAEALNGGAAAALAGVVVGLGTIDEGTHERAVAGLRRVPSAVAALAAAMAHADDRVRSRAIETIVTLGDAALVATQGAIRAALLDGSPDVAQIARSASARLLRVTSPQLLEPAPFPVDQFDGGALSEKQVAQATKASVELLTRFACDGRERVRRNAWRVFAAKGALDRPTTALAIVALKDEDQDVRALAAAALEKPAPDDADILVPALIRARLDKAHAVRVAVLKAIEANADHIARHLEAQLDAREDRLADAVVDTIAEVGAKRILASLRPALRHPGAIHRTLALRGLARLGDSAAATCWDDVLAALSDPYDPMRAAALAAIASQPRKVQADGKLQLRLQAMYQDDASWIVRSAAERTLRVTSRAPRA